MTKRDEFVSVIQNEFETDRLTIQNTLPTFHPESAEEAARLFRLANQHEQQVYITGFGNNIDPVGEKFVGLIIVRTDRLNQLIEINPQDLYVTAGAGYPLRELNHHLLKQKLFVPHGQLPYVGSVGGAIAVGLSARHMGHDLPLKRYFLKAEIVTPEGEIITPGSVCFKSASGYDVVKVFAGSWGLLGLVVSATIRVMPDTALDEYELLSQNETNREAFLAGLAKSNVSHDAVYARKIKQKFDPRAVLPIV